MKRNISKADFENAPIKYKGEYSEIFEKISDEYDKRLVQINRTAADPEDILKIIEIEAAAGSEDRMAECINKLDDTAKEVLIIGRTKYGKPKYIIIIGPISNREYFDCFCNISI